MQTAIGGATVLLLGRMLRTMLRSAIAVGYVLPIVIRRKLLLEGVL